ncbi:hypothetical protein Tco_0895968 [Tanacetum coccineum]|uniref:Uncharacterized protein n=1 Tax=Tanacetum coccineum TaxID=301880 RepID=A0ABQ5CG36_9ASTR
MSSPVFVNSVIISVKSGFDNIVTIDGRGYDSKINLLLICFRSKFENSLHSFPYHSKLLMYNDRDHSISCIGLVRDTMQSLALPMMFVLLVYRRTGPLITYPDDDSPDEICVILRCLNGLFALFSPQVMGVHHEDRPDLLWCLRCADCLDGNRKRITVDHFGTLDSAVSIARLGDLGALDSDICASDSDSDVPNSDSDS